MTRKTRHEGESGISCHISQKLSRWLYLRSRPRNGSVVRSDPWPNAFATIPSPVPPTNPIDSEPVNPFRPGATRGDFFRSGRR
jgi:hypothetical protein